MAVNDYQKFNYGISSKPFGQETVSGDLGFVKVLDDIIFLSAIDVAGHGIKAAKIARTILSFLQMNCSMNLPELVKKLHESLKGTRGCAGSFCRINISDFELEYLGVGDTKAKVFGEDDKNFFNRPGIIGYVLPILKCQNYTLKYSDVLVCHSDGVKSHFQINSLHIGKNESSLTIAKSIISQYGKESDDSICVVLKREK
jgi:serine phosphatase RsbU (regulator of sigma subunit)